MNGLMLYGAYGHGNSLLDVKLTALTERKDVKVTDIFMFWCAQKIDEKAVNEVFLKVLDNYIKWCRYLRIRLAWNR